MDEVQSLQERNLMKIESKTEVKSKEAEYTRSDNLLPVSPDQIDLVIIDKDNITKTSPAELKNSGSSTAPLDFEEAVNTTEQEVPPMLALHPTKSTSPEPSISNTSVEKPSVLTQMIRTQLHDNDQDAMAPTLGMRNIVGQANHMGSVKPGGQLYDIDSLNEIKKASDLASKKVEITSQIFEMLVNEIKDMNLNFLKT